jgi:hypothetical protein
MSINPPPSPAPDNDPIIKAVIQLNAAYTNKNYAKHNPIVIRGANVYKVTFQSQGGTWYENYVYQRGARAPIPYESLSQLLRAGDNDLIPHGPDLELIRMATVGFFTLMFGVAVIYLVFHPSPGDSIQILTGFVGTGFGYLVGKPWGSSKKDSSD